MSKRSGSKQGAGGQEWPEDMRPQVPLRAALWAAAILAALGIVCSVVSWVWLEGRGLTFTLMLVAAGAAVALVWMVLGFGTRHRGGK